MLWTVAQKEVAQSDLPQAQELLDELPAQFEQKTKVKWDAFLNSLGGEFGLVITLDKSNNIPIPLPGGALEIPAPGLLIALKVNDDTIFNRIDAGIESQSAGHQRGQARPQNADDARAHSVHRRTPAQRRQQWRLSVHRLERCD